MCTIGQMFCLKLTKNSLNKLKAYVQVSSTRSGKELGLNEHIYLFSFSLPSAMIKKKRNSLDTQNLTKKNGG